MANKPLDGTSSNFPSNSFVYCYKCETQGFFRSNCPDCKMNELSTIGSYSLGTLVSSKYRLVLKVDILGHFGQGLVETAEEIILSTFSILVIQVIINLFLSLIIVYHHQRKTFEK